MGLPKSNGNETILLVVDRLTKYGHFFTLPRKFDSKSVAKVLIQDIVKLHGITRSLVSDRDRIFIGEVWTEMARIQGTELCMSSAYHPQTDGQTETLNRCLEMYLRCMADEEPSKWEQHLSWVEYWYNTAYQSSAGMTPFKALYGRDPLTLRHYLEGSSKNDHVDQEMKERDEILCVLKKNLLHDQITPLPLMKDDSIESVTTYNIEDKVLVEGEGDVVDEVSESSKSPRESSYHQYLRSEGRSRGEPAISRESRQRVWTLFVSNIVNQLQWQGVWQVFDRHGEVVDVFISMRRSRRGQRFGFVQMATRVAALRVIERLHMRWIYGTRILVAFALRRGRDETWHLRKERQRGTIEVGGEERRHVLDSGESVTGKGRNGLHKSFTGVVAEDKLEVLDSCAVAWCKEGLRGRALVEELRRAEICGCSVMRISGAMVLLMFVTTEERQALLDRYDLDRWFARIVAWSPKWGKLIRVEGSTMEPQSFERAMFFIKSDKMDRIEEMVEVKTSEGLVVQVRVQEVEVVHSHDVICPCEQKSEKDDSVDVPNGVCEGPVTRENPLFWNGEADRGVADEDVGFASGTGLQGTMGELVVTNFGEREQSQEVDLGAKSPDSLKSLENSYFELGCTEIVSNQQVVAHQDNSAVEIVLSKGLSRKVRLVNDLVIDTLSNEQRNRLLRHRGRMALLKEAEATVQLGKLVGVETLGREEELIKDITLSFSSNDRAQNGSHGLFGDMLKLLESFMFQGSGGRVIQNTTTEAILMMLIAARTKLLQSSTLTVDGGFSLSHFEFRTIFAIDMVAGLILVYLCLNLGMTSTTSVDPIKLLARMEKEH
ncbi:hypothetical protein GQ457_06G009120 [Hibiscus cannabinus]